MSTSIENSFVRHYETDVHLAFQRMGSKLRNTVRVRNNATGTSTTFQKIGKGEASTKARHGKVPVMNIDHEPVEVKLKDYYAGDWLDALDEIRIDHDEKQVTINAGAYALGRRTDQLIIDELETLDSKHTVSGTGDLADSIGLTKEKILNAFELLGARDVPDDNDRFAIIGWRQWGELLEIDEFSNADYIGDSDLPWKGTQAKRWLGTLWMPHSGLSISSSGIRNCYWYHRTAVGHAIGQEVKTDVTWHGDRAAWFINNMMSQGAGLVDPDGVMRLRCKEL